MSCSSSIGSGGKLQTLRLFFFANGILTYTEILTLSIDSTSYCDKFYSYILCESTIAAILIDKRDFATENRLLPLLCTENVDNHTCTNFAQKRTCKSRI